MNFKSLLLGSSLVLSTFGLYACGDDSSGSSAGPEEEQAKPLELPQVSEKSPLDVEKSRLVANVLSDGAGGNRLNITGTLTMDDDFGLNEYDDDAMFFNFDSLSFIAGKIEGSQVNETNLVVADQTVYPKDRVNMATAIQPIDLKQLEGCGDFRFYVVAYMSADQTHEHPSSAMISTDFKKPCDVIESSSSAVETCTALTPSEEITISNQLATDITTYNFAGGTAPHITLVTEGNASYFQAGAGVEIWEEGGALETGLVPTEAVCQEKLEKSFGTKKDPMELTSGMWYYITTPEGPFAVMVRKIAKESATKSAVTIIYLKK